MGREISEMTTFTSEDRQAAQKEMNNKPVAWMTEEALKGLSIPFLSQVTLMTALKASQVDDFNIPLYTHPVKELKNIVLASATCSCGKVMEVTNLQPVKELTDEEIYEVIYTEIGSNNMSLYQIARAILRKAQEK